MIKRLLQAYKLLKAADEFNEPASRDGFFTKGDSEALNNNISFQKLMAMMRNGAITAAKEACQPHKRGEFWQGAAYGVQMTVQALENNFPESDRATSDNLEESELEQLPELFAS